MCGRYWFEESPELRPFVEAMNRSPLMERFGENATVTTQGEVRPMDVVPVIATNRRGEPAAFPMRWGFRGNALMINARVETAAEKPTFKEAWKAHRCIVPARHYFEWEHLTGSDGRKKTGRKYMIRPRDGGVAWMCGLYRLEAGIPVFVVLTRAPGEGIRFIHDRMPLMMPGACARDWIRPEVKPETLIDAALTDMAYSPVEVPPSDGQLSMFPNG